MASMDKTYKGKPFQHGIALHSGVQKALHEDAKKIASRAQADLAEHRAEGHSYIDIEHGKVDWHVVLNDERGLRAALSIEFGRPRKGDMAGLKILTKALRGGG